MRAIFLVIELAFVAGTLAVIFLGGEYWPFDLITFFWPILAIFAVVLVVLSLFFGGLPVKLLAIAGLGFSFYVLFGLPPAPDVATGNRLRVLTANLFVENPSPSDFITLLSKEQPEIVVTEETRPDFERAIRDAGLFPFESTGNLRANDDKKVFSRYPIRLETRLSEPAGSLRLYRHPIRFVIDAPDGPIVLYAVHPDTPRSLEQWYQRNAYLELLAYYVRQEPENAAVIIAGDWNTPAYSPYFSRFFATTGYRFARPGWWLPVTRFTTRLKRFAYLGSTIDHVAVSPQLRVMNWQRGRDFGSNHLPVIVDIVLPGSNAVALK